MSVQDDRMDRIEQELKTCNEINNRLIIIIEKIVDRVLLLEGNSIRNINELKLSVIEKEDNG